MLKFLNHPWCIEIIYHHTHDSVLWYCAIMMSTSLFHFIASSDRWLELAGSSPKHECCVGVPDCCHGPRYLGMTMCGWKKIRKYAAENQPSNPTPLDKTVSRKSTPAKTPFMSRERSWHLYTFMKSIFRCLDSRTRAGILHVSLSFSTFSCKYDMQYCTQTHWNMYRYMSTTYTVYIFISYIVHVCTCVYNYKCIDLRLQIQVQVGCFIDFGCWCHWPQTKSQHRITHRCMSIGSSRFWFSFPRHYGIRSGMVSIPDLEVGYPCLYLCTFISIFASKYTWEQEQVLFQDQTIPFAGNPKTWYVQSFVGWGMETDKFKIVLSDAIVGAGGKSHDVKRADVTGESGVDTKM